MGLIQTLKAAFGINMQGVVWLVLFSTASVMSNPRSNPNVQAEPAASENPLSTPRILRAFTGSFIAGTMGVLFYKMLTAIATTFANKPVVSDNTTVVNLSAAVRTLVMGTIALGTGVFGMAAIGLFLLGIQMMIQRLSGQTADTPNTPSS